MPSPDLRPYLGDVVLFTDVTPQDLAQAAIDILRDRLPGWEPLEANTEVMLLEALCSPISELAYLVNRLPGAVLEAFLRLLGAGRDPGRPATGHVAMYPGDPEADVEVPAGTRFRLEVDATAEAVTFTLDEATILPGGMGPQIGEVTATTNTAAANGDHYGEALTIVDPVNLVAATVVGAFAGGRAPEQGDEYLERASVVLGRLTDTLVMPAHFTARALELINEGVYRATTLNLWDADEEELATGHVTVAVCGPAGADLFDNFPAIQADLAARALASLVVHVIGPTITEIDVFAEVAVADGYDPSTVQAEGTAALIAYLDPDRWDWSTTLRRNRLIQALLGIEGVEEVTLLLDGPGGDPLEDVTLPGPAPLTKAGNIEVATT